MSLKNSKSAGKKKLLKRINSNKMERELGYYWVQWEEKDNWLIFWFNGGYWQCCAMGIIELNDKNILSIDEHKLRH